MIYWDNGATTWPKPHSVMMAVGQAVRYGANPGRAGHSMAMNTAENVYLCREKLAEFFGLNNPSGVVFTANCTTALNTVIQGVLGHGGRAVTSDLEHNAVMRPLAAVGNYDVAKWSLDEGETVENVRRAIRMDTKLLICTHASNVFGVTLPIRKLGELAKEYGLLFCVDAAQSAGVLPIDMQRDNVDYLCIAPHKGLYAPMGTGALLCNTSFELTPLVRGGTGSHSISLDQPTELPDRLESGTVNVPGIAGIRAGIEFVSGKGRETIARHEIELLQYVYDRLSGHPSFEFYTPRPCIGASASALSLNVKGYTGEQTASFLNEQGIAVRGGLHCAPMAHRRFGTLERGTVRLAPSAFSTRLEAENICKLFLQIAEKSLH